VTVAIPQQPLPALHKQLVDSALPVRFCAVVRLLNLKELAIGGLIAAVYAVLAIALAPISFAVYQVRVAEALTVLPFITPGAIPGLYFGCLIANVYGGMGWMDIVFGALITLAAAFATRGVFVLSRHRAARALAILPVILLWVVGFLLLLQLRFEVIAVGWLMLAAFGALAGARLAASYASRPAYISVYAASIIFLLLSLTLYRDVESTRSLVVAGLVLAGAWLSTIVNSYFWIKGRNPLIVLAPLPPVLFNAFGVAAYLAPILDFDYWFAVQMIGIGQLISCYLLGLPLLLMLEKRRAMFS